MSDETVTLELSEIELGTLKDAVRWQREYAEENNLRRVRGKLDRLEGAIEEQTHD